MPIEEWLSDFIKNGILKDNQIYYVNKSGSDCFISNYYFDNPIKIIEKKKGEWNRIVKDNEAVWFFLSSIGSTIQKLIKDPKTSSLILFNEREYEHNTDDSFISISGNLKTGGLISTGNLIGYVKQGELALKINSRFGDSFLKYIISDADGFLELKEMGGVDCYEGYEWLLAYIWNVKIKKAFRLGLPKSYETHIERISRVLGNVDLLDFSINKKIAKYKCSYREYRYNSLVLDLFIEAYRQINKYDFCKSSRSIYLSFIKAKCTYKSSIDEILNVKYFSNPFYKDYNEVIDISKKILKNKEAEFNSFQDNNALLFDVSMLFEYFIRKLFNRNKIGLLDKYKKVYKIHSCSLSDYERRLEPDLIFERHDGLYIFDVKYKKYDEKFGVLREDLFQLHTYIGQYGNDSLVKGCGFIYPMKDNALSKDIRIIKKNIKQNNYVIPFYVIFLVIPDDSLGWNDFQKNMNESCNLFIQTFIDNVFL